MPENRRKKVFISYSWRPQGHKEKVCQLTAALINNRVDCKIDHAMFPQPDQGWHLWTQQQVENADFVIVVCSPEYYEADQVQGDENFGEPDRPGKGVVWEARFIRDYLYGEHGRNIKIIPIAFEPDNRKYIPFGLRTYNFYELLNPIFEVGISKPYEDLLRHILGKPYYEFPTIGDEPELSTAKVELPSGERIQTRGVKQKLTALEIYHAFQPFMHQPLPNRHQAKLILTWSVGATIFLMLIRLLGWWEWIEFPTFDFLMNARKLESHDSRILIINIDENDVQKQKDRGELGESNYLKDPSLSVLLDKLEKYSPSVIGFDLYRDFKAKIPKLDARLKKIENLVSVCDLPTENNPTDNIAPSEIPINNLGFANIFLDKDNVVRRHVLVAKQTQFNSYCNATRSFSLLLASRYLKQYGINYNEQEEPSQNLKIGDRLLSQHASPKLPTLVGGFSCYSFPEMFWHP